MAKIWRNLLIKDEKSYLEVPSLWQSQVKNLLKQDVESELITAERYAEIVGEPCSA